MDLYDEFVSIIEVLETERIPYAVCGGMAMAIHGLPRATVDCGSGPPRPYPGPPGRA